MANNEEALVMNSEGYMVQREYGKDEGTKEYKKGELDKEEYNAIIAKEKNDPSFSGKKTLEEEKRLAISEAATSGGSLLHQAEALPPLDPATVAFLEGSQW